MKFEPGAVVRLKSGGPNMTVDHYQDDMQQYICSWFDGKKRFEGGFQETSLVQADKTTGLEPWLG